MLNVIKFKLRDETVLFIPYSIPMIRSNKKITSVHNASKA